MEKTQANIKNEPYFYIALIMKGSEKQYLNLLEYMNNNNRAQIIYQCKSLTYLHVTREDGVTVEAAAPECTVEQPTKIGEM
jgi:hypothetical protein